MSNEPGKKIIHMDMDAFYASVEQRDQPSLRGKPVVVGGDPQSRGVVASASYEARRWGIRSAMSSSKAQRLCPQVIFVRPHFDKYVEASHKMREVFYSVTPLVEPLALDEAYLDVTENLLGERSASKIAQWIKRKIFQETGLTASAGVGPNKFIAKLASDFQKPNGLVIVPPSQVEKFIEGLPIEKFWGVGPATAAKLHRAGFRTASDIRKTTVSELESIVGSYGEFLYELAFGRDSREVDPSLDRKSLGVERTFEEDILDIDVLKDYVGHLSNELSGELKNSDYLSRTVTVKIKYSDFKSITRSRTLPYPIDDSSTISQIAKELLLRETEVGRKPVRLLGISMSHLISKEGPLQLWFDFSSK
jgi:DNA polymerase-4